jgi:hypothetical protein
LQVGFQNAHGTDSRYDGREGLHRLA